jgi:hypothetical protein
MMKSLEALGFVNYLDVKGTDKLQLVDKCIVQLDSLGMVLRSGCIIPQYDLVVMDASESTLHHATAATLKTNQRRVFDALCSTIKIADRSLVMDALLGRETREFLTSLGKVPVVVRSTWRSDTPRTFEFTNAEGMCLKAIRGELGQGHNCAVASMSAKWLNRLKEYLVNMSILNPEEILIIEGETADAIKRQVRDVNTFWARFRLVMWSPAVEAGVDFNVRHFHRMFVIISNMSTVAMGLVQSSGRIRQLENREVLCLCLKGVKLEANGEEMRPEDAVALAPGLGAQRQHKVNQLQRGQLCRQAATDQRGGAA